MSMILMLAMCQLVPCCSRLFEVVLLIHGFNCSHGQWKWECFEKLAHKTRDAIHGVMLAVHRTLVSFFFFLRTYFSRSLTIMKWQLCVAYLIDRMWLKPQRIKPYFSDLDKNLKINYNNYYKREIFEWFWNFSLYQDSICSAEFYGWSQLL